MQLRVYADLDGFTAYVSNNIATDSAAKNVVRTLHVLRSEMDAVLHEDFAGRKVRFIGDCVHGLVVEGTAQTTNEEETITNLTLCAGGMRSSFNLALAKLKDDGTDAVRARSPGWLRVWPDERHPPGHEGRTYSLFCEPRRPRRGKRTRALPGERDRHRPNRV